MSDCVFSARGARTTLVEEVFSPREARTFLGGVESPREARTTLVYEIQSPREACTGLWPTTYKNIFLTPTESTIRRGVPVVTHQLLLVNGVTEIDLTPYLLELTFERDWNQMGAGRILLVDSSLGVATHPSRFVPPGTGTFAGLIRRYKQDGSRYLLLKLTSAGVREDFYFLPGKPTFPNDEVLDWPITDFTPLLEVEGKKLTDILRHGGGVTRTAHTAIKEEAALVGINVRCDFPDFAVGEQRRQDGTPLSRMDELAKIRQAGRRWEGRTLVYEEPKFSPAATAGDVIYIDRLTLENFSMEEDPDRKNQFKCTRIETTGNVIGEDDCIGPQCVGRTINVPLDPPSKTVHPLGKGEGGTLEFFTWFNGTRVVGASTKMQPMVFAVPADRVEATYKPRLETVVGITRHGRQAKWELQVLGTVQPGSGGYSFTKNADATHPDYNHQGDYGVQPEFTNLETTVIPDGTVAEQCCQAVLDESIRHTWRGSGDSPFVASKLRPGHVAIVTDWLTNQTSRAWHVRGVGLNFAREAGWSQAWRGIRPYV